MTLDELLQELLAKGVVKVEIRLSLEQQDSAESPDKILGKCDKCGWSKTYSSERAKARGLRAHAQHCTGKPHVPAWLQEQTNSRD